MTRILLVEDDQAICEMLRLYIENEGFELNVIHDGKAAIEKIKEHTYDIVVLDVMLPGMDGFNVCREVRKISEMPIIMLTARGEEHERILGLELGADDYLVKPFSPKELIARLKAQLRRYKFSANISKDITREDQIINIDQKARRITVKGQEMNLTPKEYDLLAHLAVEPNRVFTREELLELVWGNTYFDTRTVDTHIKQLRVKLQQVAPEVSFITTVWKAGYMFEVKK